LVFVVFFINLFYYIPFPTTGSDSSPEIIAVVFTNVVILAIAGVIIYEINRTLFHDSLLAVFGTVTCLTSSSYFFWTTGCKDHILVLLLFVIVLLGLIKFMANRECWFLALAFIASGLLAWARPELALWVALGIGGIWIFTMVRHIKMLQCREKILLVIMPFFTVIGALPFFLNNYLITKNPLIPTLAIYLSKKPGSSLIQGTSNLQQSGVFSGDLILKITTMNEYAPSTDIPGDIFGILFHPQNGSIGLLALTPLFLAMFILAILFTLSGTLVFTHKEKKITGVIMVMALSVFLAYSNNLPQLNTSVGMTPDIRYLSPLYCLFTLLGLIILWKIPTISKNPLSLLQQMLVLLGLGIPFSIWTMSLAYADPHVASGLFSALNNFLSLVIFFLVTITILVILWADRVKSYEYYSLFLIASLCIFPLIWQIDISVYVWQFSTSEGYPPWIPVTRVLYNLFSSPILL
jgi:hypothetical protein